MALADQLCSHMPMAQHGPDAQARRYALYYAPEPGTPLADFGRSWFGYDAESGLDVAERQDYGIGPEACDAMTREPRHYGLHGTLRAPFRLRPGVTEENLIERTARFAEGLAPIELDPPTVQRIGAFLALALPTPSPALERLHARCLFAFEHFRAPLTEAERAKRLRKKLTSNQLLLLAQWGYPYVLDEFRFHVTLTGVLSDHDQARVAPVLSPALKDICLAPLEVDAICLFTEAGDGRPFKLLRRFPFACGKNASL